MSVEVTDMHQYLIRNQSQSQNRGRVDSSSYSLEIVSSAQQEESKHQLQSNPSSKNNFSNVAAQPRQSSLMSSFDEDEQIEEQKAPRDSANNNSGSPQNASGISDQQGEIDNF